MGGLNLVRAPASLATLIAATALLLLAALALAPHARAAAGFLDPTFGSGGFTILDDPADVQERLEDLAIQADGKILAAGSRNGANGFLLARFNPDGSPDLSFGIGGISVLPYTGETGSPRVIADIEQRADGKIVATGLGEGLAANAIMFARYLPNGELDSSWGKGGLRLVAISPYATAHGLALAPDGKIVAVGQSATYAPVVRLTEDGKNDESFNAAPIGLREVDIPGVTMEDGRAVEVLADGTILLGGQAGAKGAFLAELDVNGEKVVGFGEEGIETQDLGTDTTPSGSIEDIEVLPDGRILTAGYARVGPGSANELVVARFKPNGELDPTFAAGGIFRSDPTVASDKGEALRVQPDGKIVVAGERGQTISGGADTWLLRLTPDGQLDPTFGTGGETVASASPEDDQAHGLVLDADRRPVVAGYADVAPDGHRLMVGRFGADEVVKVTMRPSDLGKAPRCGGRRATIVGTARADRVKGTRRADVIASLGGKDRIDAGGGNDLVCAGGGNDLVKGGKGRDRVLGGAGKDRMVGGPGEDVCLGGPGKDVEAGSCERPKSAG